MNTLHPIFKQALAPFFIPHRFPVTYCSQCGEEFGPGEEGFSDCRQHTPEGIQARHLATFKAQTLKHWNTP